MIATSEIGDEVTSIATAIGLLKEKSPGSFQLQTDFFSSPASHLGAMLSNSEQRDALLRALDGLIPPASPLSLNGSGRRYHPLLEQSDNGQLFLTVAKDSNQADALIELGVAAEAGTEAGPVVTAELPLLTAQGSTVTPIAGTPDGALKLAVRVPLGLPVHQLRGDFHLPRVDRGLGAGDERLLVGAEVFHEDVVAVGSHLGGQVVIRGLRHRAGLRMIRRTPGPVWGTVVLDIRLNPAKVLGCEDVGNHAVADA